jgi:hypothetical protein
VPSPDQRAPRKEQREGRTKNFGYIEREKTLLCLGMKECHDADDDDSMFSY